MPPLRYLLYLIASVLLFPSCSKIRYVTMNAMRPADITFPSDVNTLLLVDRTHFEQKENNVIEGILTGELPGVDRAGVMETMMAFQNRMTATPRFQTLRANEVLNGNNMTMALPPPLSWDEVAQLCLQYKADVVVAIELFDSDFFSRPTLRRVGETILENGLKGTSPSNLFYFEGVGNVHIGFRIYDPTLRTIVDEQVFTETNRWEASGPDPAIAATRIIHKTEAIKHISRMAGNRYAYKIAPLPIRISREFYGRSRKVSEVAAGSRLADVGQWQEAANKWESGLAHARRDKEAGYLCYDIGIAYEVLGDLVKAKSWADRAYVDHGNKKAREYSNLLKRRMSQEQAVDEQMK